jgi:putative spermidine/putrescine transport system permease protein
MSRRGPGGPAALLFVYMALFMLFIMLPIAAVVVVSFSSSSYIAFPMPGFSLKWYRHIVAYAPFMTSLATSI